ncbi:hypothetical protein FPZ12_016995 [Amycolatopsis acidicola]|uniref:Uncharacterized protein n=1 Tax=Amycolatopsis acidicola TaxID=2596893 RepID=A0A5N0V610_9PSEU|nr:hypothetical protein [Amycolatopsis acidicola]KAA9160530.1 hypothetical protein FPZ12_016995 [Amycolatopsis acidicola]
MGLNVTDEDLSGGTTSMAAALARGSIDVASGGTIGFIQNLSSKAISRTGYPFPDVYDALHRVLDAFGVERVAWARTSPGPATTTTTVPRSPTCAMTSG